MLDRLYSMAARYLYLVVEASTNISPDEITALASVIVALAAVIGIPIALIQVGALLRSKRQEKQTQQQESAKQLLNIYLKEYRSPQMGRAIAGLWLLYRRSNSNEKMLIENYKRLYKKQKNKNFHFDFRRRVSVFYQELALFVESDEYAKEEVYSLWAKANLDLIPKVLIPIERTAIPEIIAQESGDRTTVDLPTKSKELDSISAMHRLYINAPESLETK